MELNRRHASKDQLGYDLARLHQLAKGDTDFIVEILELFVQNAENNLQELKDACCNQNWKQISLKAHKLTPSCSYLGIHKMVEILKEIESSAERSTDPIVFEQLVTRAYDAYYQVKTSMLLELDDKKKESSSHA
jgi:HPt (histidine-containing phosphotransfer) domain-containing protein